MNAWIYMFFACPAVSEGQSLHIAWMTGNRLHSCSQHHPEIQMTTTPKFTTRAAAMKALDAAERRRDSIYSDGYHDDDTIDAAEAEVNAAQDDVDDAERYEEEEYQRAHDGEHSEEFWQRLRDAGYPV
jgi:multidrug resistance efflux pump